MKATGLMDEHGQPVVDLERGIKTVQQAAATTAFAATSPLLEGIGGVYRKDNDISELDRDPQPLTAAEKAPPADVVQYAIDPQSARRRELSEELIKGCPPPWGPRQPPHRSGPPPRRGGHGPHCGRPSQSEPVSALLLRTRTAVSSVGLPPVCCCSSRCTVPAISRGATSPQRVTRSSSG